MLTKPKHRVSNRTDVDSVDELIQNSSKYNSADHLERLVSDEDIGGGVPHIADRRN